MRILVDECLYMQIVEQLRADGHDVEWTGDRYRGAGDDVLLEWALREQALLISEDQDFGELIFRGGLPAFGVVRVRLGEFPSSLESVAVVVARVIRELGVGCIGQMTVIEPGRVRQRPLPR